MFKLRLVATGAAALMLGATASADSAVPQSSEASAAPIMELASEGNPSALRGELTPAVVTTFSNADLPLGDEPAPAEPVEPVDAASAPPVRSTNLAELVASHRSSEPGSRQLECLAGAIYFESKSESHAGQLAVGQVIANRASSGRFPASYCGVVFQRGQFSFVRGGRLPAIPRSSLQWKTAVAIARIVDQRLHDASPTRALFFHARHVSPRWKLTRVGTIGNHVFYR